MTWIKQQVTICGKRHRREIGHEIVFGLVLTVEAGNARVPWVESSKSTRFGCLRGQPQNPDTELAKIGCKGK